MIIKNFYLKASYFGPPHKPVSDNVEYGNSASKSRGVKSMQKTDIFSKRCHLAINWHVSRLPHITRWHTRRNTVWSTELTKINDSKSLVQQSAFCNHNYHQWHLERYLDFSFVCTFVPRSEKSTEKTFAPVVLWNIRCWGAKSPRTFAPWNFRTRGTFTPLERMF